MRGVAHWIPPASLALAVAGAAASTYLTIAHYTRHEVLACSTSGPASCELVTTSPQSRFVGIPVAVLGLVWFVGMIALCVPTAWRTQRRLVHLTRMVASAGGVGFALWLVYAELFIVHAICLWCTFAHLMALGLFVLVVITTSPLLVPDE